MTLDQALQDLALEVDGLAHQVEDVRMRLGQVRGLVRGERKVLEDPDRTERVAARDLLIETRG